MALKVNITSVGSCETADEYHSSYFWLFLGISKRQIAKVDKICFWKLFTILSWLVFPFSFSSYKLVFNHSTCDLSYLTLKRRLISESELKGIQETLSSLQENLYFWPFLLFTFFCCCCVSGLYLLLLSYLDKLVWQILILWSDVKWFCFFMHFVSWNLIADGVCCVSISHFKV